MPALVAFSDVWRSNDVRYLSNYMPYWNRALTVIPAGEKPILLCALSPRVYPWIRSVTLHETILAEPHLIAQLVKLCAERGWTRVGVLDHEGLPVRAATGSSPRRSSRSWIFRGIWCVRRLLRVRSRHAPARSEVGAGRVGE